jgi:DDE superfamily endonuclease
MNLPTFAQPVLTMLRPTFSTPTYNRFLVLLLGTLLTTGRRTITNILRTVLSRRRWSTWVMARAMIRFLLDHVAPPGPVLLAGDDAVTEHPGPQVFGKGRHRDGVRSSHSYTAYRWGHKRVVMSMLVKLPFATRPWALPVLVALYRPPEWDRVHRTRHKTPAHTARLLLAQVPVLEGWIDAAAEGPTPFIVLGDFNRRFNQPGDRVWADRDDGEPANADVTALTQEMPISCRDNTFTEFIDHIVVDPRVLRWVDRTSFRHITYGQADKAVWNQISDHCPLLVELWIR